MKIAGLALLVGAAALAATAALAQEGTPIVPLRKAIGQVTQTGPVASLFVLNARGATLADGKLTLTGVSPSSIAFADRPVRAAGHIETAQFVEKWKEGEDQANIDPPNATVSVLSGASVADAVVTISKPVKSCSHRVEVEIANAGPRRFRLPVALATVDLAEASLAPNIHQLAG